MSTKLEKVWAGFILGLISQTPEAYVQIRKIFRDRQLSIPWDKWDGVSMGTERMGYSSGPSKINQLKRNYLDVEALEKLRDSFKARSGKSQSCITARFGNKAKDSRSQGFCMQTITLNYLEKPLPGNPKLVVELYYRSTEVGQKFLADLLFLDKVVFPILLDGLPTPDEVRFKFSTLYLSSMFLPLVMQVLEPSLIVETARGGDPKWFKTCVRTSVQKWMVEECGYNYRTRAKMHRLFREYVYPTLSPSEKRRIKEAVK